MKYLRICALAILASATATTAWAQYGLYGAPEMLPLSQAPEGGYLSTPASGMPQPIRPAYAPAAPGYANQLMQTAAGDPVPPVPQPLRSATPSAALQPTPQAPSVVNQMLSEGDAIGPSSPWNPQAGCGFQQTVEDSECTGPDPCVPCFQPCWYASASGLMMFRERANRVWTTYETNNNPNQLMHTQDISDEWSGGGEIRFGRYFCCGAWAVEAAYWSLDSFTGFASQTVAGGSVSTPLIISDIEFDGVNGTQLFDSAEEHRLWRKNELHNIELNVIRNQVDLPCASTVSVDWMAGARFFRFDEDLTFGSLDLGGTWGGNGGLDEAYLRDSIRNDLVGFQIGFNVDWSIGYNCRLFLTPKFGVYNNHIKHRFDAFRGDGQVASPTAASGMTGTYPVVSTTDTMAFLTEINLGLDWQFAPRWSAFVGYRVVAATGIGLADNQIPPYIVDIPELADIDVNGELVLHGAFAGLTFDF